MAEVVETKGKRWTYEEYYRLNDDQRYEIIEGNLLTAPAPDTPHQDWSRRLFRLLDHFVIGDPANKSLEVLVLRRGSYELHCSAQERGKVTSLVLSGFAFDLRRLNP